MASKQATKVGNTKKERKKLVRVEDAQKSNFVGLDEDPQMSLSRSGQIDVAHAIGDSLGQLPASWPTLAHSTAGPLMSASHGRKDTAQASSALLNAIQDYIGESPAVVDSLACAPQSAPLQDPARAMSTAGAQGTLRVKRSVENQVSNRSADPHPALTSDRIATLLRHLRGMASSHARSASTSSPSGALDGSASMPPSLHTHMLRWGQDLGIFQAMRAAGFTDTELDSFVSKLMPDVLTSTLVDGVAVKGEKQRSESQLVALPLPSRSLLQQPAWSQGLSAASVPPVDAPQPAQPQSTGCAATPRPADAVSPGPYISSKVSPFIQRPYKLLSDLHVAAQRSSSDAKGGSGAVGSTAPYGSEGPSAEPATGDSSSTVCAGNSNQAVKLVAAHHPGSAWYGQQVDVGAVGKTADSSGASEGCNSAACDTAQSEQSRDSDAGVTSAWQSVLNLLSGAGPQEPHVAAPPESPGRMPSSAGWASTQSSTEQDTFSSKSGDTPPVTVKGPPGGGTTQAGAAKGKKKRKKGKGRN